MATLQPGKCKPIRRADGKMQELCRPRDGGRPKFRRMTGRSAASRAGSKRAGSARGRRPHNKGRKCNKWGRGTHGGKVCRGYAGRR